MPQVTREGTMNTAVIDLHHFDENTRPKTPGNIAVWILIYAELTEFALFFLIFLIAKWLHPEIFQDGPPHLNTLAGAANTIILVTSSFFIAQATQAIKVGKRRVCLKWLWLTLLAGAGYCAIKGWEYHWNSSAGIHPTNNLFFSFYYYLTFNHLLHVLIGMCTILWVTLRTYFNAYSVDDHEGLDNPCHLIFSAVFRGDVNVWFVIPASIPHVHACRW